MVNVELAEASNTLFNVAFVLYLVAMVAYFFGMAFTRVSVAGVPTGTVTGQRAGLAATALTLAGAGVHLASLVTRGLAAGRVPWANMYEYSSCLALGTVLVGLYVVQRRLGYGHLMGFVLALAVLSMTSALLLFTEASPVMPALQSYWIKIHTSAAMLSSSIFIVAFAATALYLVKDSAERRLAARSGRSFGASTVGAAQVRAPEPVRERDGASARGRDGRDGDDLDGRPEGYASPDQPLGEAEAGVLAERDTLSPVAFPIVPFAVVAVFTFALWRSPVAALLAGSVAAVLGIVTWYSIPYMPPAARLDSLAYRVTAFAFPIWTFAVLAGAIWAQEAWGRYWGWDPKETGSFFTWVLYAGYLHARSTRGWRGRRAGWVGVIAFGALMVTYYAVNLFIVGLHSYAGV